MMITSWTVDCKAALFLHMKDLWISVLQLQSTTRVVNDVSRQRTLSPTKRREDYLTALILGRWLRALKKPDAIFAKADEVQSVIVDIRQLCDELLDKRVHSIKELNIGG